MVIVEGDIAREAIEAATKTIVREPDNSSYLGQLRASPGEGPNGPP